MSEFGVRGIDLFKIAGESISGWIPSWKTGEARPTRQPFCSQMEEQPLLYLEYHPQVAWYGRGDISATFASTWRPFQTGGQLVAWCMREYSGETSESRDASQ